MDRPTVVCLSGSARFVDAFDEANLRETLAGRIVLGIATSRRPGVDMFADLSPQAKAATLARLASLHRAKIDLADELLVLNVGGYVGRSTAAEIAYAERTGTPVRYLEPPAADEPGESPSERS